jgi:hypothetical protein
VLTDNPLTLTVTSDTAVVATFKAIEVVIPTYTVTATVNDPAMGTVEGAGTYEEGATATLTATANTGYAFVSWLVDGETFTDNLLILTVESDVVVEAIFQKDLTTNTESVDTNQQKVEKRFQDGHLYILRDGDTYTTTGARVK